METGVRRFGEALARLEAELDWPRLGELYCHEGGECFFPAEQIEAQREAGLRLASALGARLRAGGRSLYVGAALGELAPILCEALVLEREVVALNLANEESRELERALRAVEQGCGFELPRIATHELCEVSGSFDHGWLVSVLNDPEAFPALHDELYGRSGELATGGGDLRAERARAEALTDAWLGKLARDSLLTTTDEELPLVEPRVAALGLRLELEPDAILSPLVGDPIRFGRLRPGA